MIPDNTKLKGAEQKTGNVSGRSPAAVAVPASAISASAQGEAWQRSRDVSSGSTPRNMPVRLLIHDGSLLHRGGASAAGHEGPQLSVR